MVWSDISGTCTPAGGACGAGETVSFSLQTFGADLSCFPHTFEWNFADGSTHTSAVPAVSHVFSGPGTYSVTVRVTGADTIQLDGTASLVITKQVVVSAAFPVLSQVAIAALALTIATAGVLKLARELPPSSYG